MFGGVPASLLIDIGRSRGVMYQLELDLETPPWVFVKPEYLKSCSKGTRVYTSNGILSGFYGSVDHPYFTETREWLSREGYIDIQRQWSNGDRVAKRFYFNNVLMEVGQQFSCAAAMSYGKYVENYNEGEPDYTVKNYNDEDTF